MAHARAIDRSMPTHHGVETKVTGSYPNKTLKLLHQRGSCRSFSDKKIPEDVLNKILKAGVHAPCAGNLQIVSIIKIEDLKRRKKIQKILGGKKFIGEAPVNLIFCIDWRRNRRWAELEVAPFTATSTLRWFLMGFEEVGIVAQSICIAADSVGLGSCYAGTILNRLKEVITFLNIPKYVFPVVLVSLGYPSGKVPNMKKHLLSTILHDETYNDMSNEELLAAFNEKYTAPGSRRVEFSEERLKVLYKTSERVHGREFAERSVARARGQGFISSVQRYFGTHYKADLILDQRTNSGFMSIIEKAGFDCFKDYEPR
jgi:nitroreductase